MIPFDPKTMCRGDLSLKNLDEFIRDNLILVKGMSIQMDGDELQIVMQYKLIEGYHVEIYPYNYPWGSTAVLAQREYCDHVSSLNFEGMDLQHARTIPDWSCLYEGLLK